jgi:ABC-type sugar transport system substrate-binding protein
MPSESSKDIKEIAVNDATIGPAIRQAAREAIERHRQAGVPVVLWENGQVVYRDAGEVLAELDAKDSSAG